MLAEVIYLKALDGDVIAGQEVSGSHHFSISALTELVVHVIARGQVL